MGSARAILRFRGQEPQAPCVAGMAGDGFGPQAARIRGKRQRECACPGFEPVAARNRSKCQRAQEVALHEVVPQAGELLDGEEVQEDIQEGVQEDVQAQVQEEVQEDVQEEVQEVELLEGAGSTCSLALAEEVKPIGSALIRVC
jgi:hypothetical protein